MAARPSIGLKDAAYFRSNSARGLLIFSVYTLLLLLFRSFFLITGMQVVYSQPSGIIIAILNFSMVLLMLPYFLWMFFGGNFALLFYLDRKQGVWIALKRSCLMIWYNLPALVLYMLLFGVVTLLISVLVNCLLGTSLSGTFYVMSYGSHSPIIILINLLLEMMLNLIYVCLATNLYIKLVHDQYELYFPEDAHKE